MKDCVHGRQIGQCSECEVLDLKEENEHISAELNLYRQALTRAVSLPKGQLPHEKGKYFTKILNGNVVVEVEQ